MAEYIKKSDAFIAIIDRRHFGETESDQTHAHNVGIRKAASMVYNLPTLDIFYCKDCKHWEPSDEVGGYCRHLEIVIENPDFFCAAGEEEENNDMG